MSAAAAEVRFHSLTALPDIAAVKQAWHGFVDRGVLDARAVRPTIRRAWERSAAARCNPLQPRADYLAPAETIALLKREEQLAQIATPFLAALSTASKGERHAAMLTDGNGRLLKSVGDEQTLEDPDFPRAGTLLSEASAGANGHGTALAEGRYVELVGPEHFIQGFHVFTCQGVPLLGPAGTPVGVLGISVRRLEVARRGRDILFCAAEAAECELLAGWLSDQLVRLQQLPDIFGRLRQDIVQGLATSRLQLECAARDVAAGTDGSNSLDAVQRLAKKFRRQAAIWRDLVADAPAFAEPISLADLVEHLLQLLQTEARVAGVEVIWSRAEKVAVLDDARGLSQRLLAQFLEALQEAGQMSTMRVLVGAAADRGTVTFATGDAGGTRRSYTTSSRLLR